MVGNIYIYIYTYTIIYLKLYIYCRYLIDKDIVESFYKQSLFLAE